MVACNCRPYQNGSGVGEVNTSTFEWATRNLPLFDCSDPDIVEAFYCWSLPHSLPDANIHPLTHWCQHSLTHSLAHLLTRSSHSLTRSLLADVKTHSLTQSLAHSQGHFEHAFLADRIKSYKSHIVPTEFIDFTHLVSEFGPSVPWGGPYGTINAAAGHHLTEGRWIRDSSYMDQLVRCAHILA